MGRAHHEACLAKKLSIVSVEWNFFSLLSSVSIWEMTADTMVASAGVPFSCFRNFSDTLARLVFCSGCGGYSMLVFQVTLKYFFFFF